MTSPAVAARSSVATQFVLLALAWGSSFLLIKIGLRDLSPAQVVLARMVIGAIALGAVVAVTRQRLPRDLRLWAHLGVVSLLLCVVPFSLFAWAEQEISSGLASIYNATTPLVAMAFAAVMLPTERLDRARVLSLGVGFAGVLVVLGPWDEVLGGGDMSSQLACLVATTCYGLGFAYLRRFVAGRGVPAGPLAFVQVLLGAVVMVAASPWVASAPIRGLSADVVISVVLLGALATGLAYLWNNNVVAAWGASNGAAVTYVSPVVGVALGMVVLREPLTWNQPLGAAIVVLGIVTAHGRFGRSPVRALGGESTPGRDERHART